ncbi:hypothetical protein VPNG_01213 [Cytospora leucostoma]|uniref:Uncharacterized protein n=1 Tax=Cytospora leucostoma TaxID=1230097 RepID=A0A423XKG9_9PEZI|nr:hypothetical protein VPNG_01213 [Cytospora leucostoma]
MRSTKMRLDTPVHIALGVQQGIVGVLDRLPLAVQVGEGRRADGLGLVGQPLARLEALGGPVEPVGAGEELLPLLELDVAGVVRVALAGAEEGGPVLGQGAELALGLVDGRLHVAVALVGLRAGAGGDVLLLDLHLAQLF